MPFCQAVTPATTKPLVKTATMPTKSWRDLAVDLMGPLSTGDSLLMSLSIIIIDGLSWMLFETQVLKRHFTRHWIPGTLRTDNGSNLVSHEMKEFLDVLGIKHKRTIPL